MMNMGVKLSDLTKRFAQGDPYTAHFQSRFKAILMLSIAKSRKTKKLIPDSKGVDSDTESETEDPPTSENEPEVVIEHSSWQEMVTQERILLHALREEDRVFYEALHGTLEGPQTRMHVVFPPSPEPEVPKTPPARIPYPVAKCNFPTAGPSSAEVSSVGVDDLPAAIHGLEDVRVSGSPGHKAERIVGGFRAAAGPSASERRAARQTRRQKARTRQTRLGPRGAEPARLDGGAGPGPRHRGTREHAPERPQRMQEVIRTPLEAMVPRSHPLYRLAKRKEYGRPDD